MGTLNCNFRTNPYYKTNLTAQKIPNNYIILLLFFSTDFPLAPENVIVNITKDGYYVSWKYTDVPGRPPVEKFIVEYREGNHSSTWFPAYDAVPAERRIYLFSAERAKADKSYDFRVFSYGANEHSNAAYVTMRYEIGE